MMLGVYVPRPDAAARKLIAPRSAILGALDRTGEDYIRVHFEGNINGASNLTHFHERAIVAAGRLKTQAPTTAVALLPASDLLQVATYDADRYVFTDVSNPEILAAWSGETLSSIVGIRLTPGPLDLRGRPELCEQMNFLCQNHRGIFYRTRAGQIVEVGANTVVHEHDGPIAARLGPGLSEQKRLYAFGAQALRATAPVPPEPPSPSLSP